MDHAGQLHADVMAVIGELMKSDPAANTAEGMALSALAEAVEKYEKSCTASSAVKRIREPLTVPCELCGCGSDGVYCAPSTVPSSTTESWACPMHAPAWCSCPAPKEPSADKIKRGAEQMAVNVEFRHMANCNVHSPTLGLCSCGLETRLREEIVRLRIASARKESSDA